MFFIRPKFELIDNALKISAAINRPQMKSCVEIEMLIY
jgi:hypothetical protein